MKTELFFLQNILKILGGHQVLHFVTLRLYQGETTFLVGAANSGKTLLARIMTGQMPPDGGKMFLLEKLYAPARVEHAHKNGVYYVSPDTPLMSNLTIAENIGLPRTPVSVLCAHQCRMLTQVRIICEDYGFPLEQEKKATNLTWMESLMLHCARAVFNGARLLIFDQVLSLLAEDDVRLLFDKLEKMKERGITVLMMEASMQYALQYGERSVFISNGRITADFPRKRLPRAQEDVLNAENLSPLAQLDVSVFDSHETQLFRCITPSGIISLPVKYSNVLGLSCRNIEQYQWYLEHCFRSEVIHELNQLPFQKRVRVLTLRQLQTEYFPDLSFRENVLLPVLPRIAAHGFITPQIQERLFSNEFAKNFSLSATDWEKKLYRLGNREREMAILHRTLLEDAEIIVFSGMLDDPDSGLQQDLWNVIQLAVERKKIVILYSRNYDLLQKWCTKIIMLDDIASS